MIPKDGEINNFPYTCFIIITRAYAAHKLLMTVRVRASKPFQAVVI